MVPFLSIVIVVRNQRNLLGEMLTVAAAYGAVLGHMCEVIVVDNASTDGSIEQLKWLTTVLPDLQVYILSEKVNDKTAQRFGLENALGDVICGERMLTREQLSAELQQPLRHGISIGSFFIGIIPKPCHVTQEFNSTRKTRRQRLNVEQAT